MEVKKHEYSKRRFGWPKESKDVTLDTFLDMGYDLSEAMDMHSEWDDAHGGPQFEICTNNQYEAELEAEWIRDRKRLYNSKEHKEKMRKKQLEEEKLAKRKCLTKRNSLED